MSKSKGRTATNGLVVAMAGVTAAAAIAFVPEIATGAMSTTGTVRTVVLTTLHTAAIAGLALTLWGYATDYRQLRRESGKDKIPHHLAKRQTRNPCPPKDTRSTP